MHPAFVRQFIAPLHERLLGRRTFPFLRQLEEAQWSSPDDLRALQNEKLRQLLAHAPACTPFYRRRFAEAGVDGASVDDATLQRIPLLDKADIRRFAADMTWRDAPGGVFEYNTGGSSGTPLTFYFDRRRQAYDQAARMRSHRWFGVNVGERELYLWGSPVELTRTHRLRRIRDALFNQRLLNAFNMSPSRMDAYLDVLERFRPTCLYGYPSSLALLIEHARFRGRSMSAKALRAVFVTGEVCFPHDREAIASFLQVPVADGYGSREGGFIAHECPFGNMHLTAENVIVEIIRDDRPVLDGETGEIVLTHLDAYAMPFIRYRTGDVGRLKPGRCRCGRGLPMMDVVEGRTTDFLYLPDGGVKHALSIIYPLRAIRSLRRFRVTQQKDYSVVIEAVRDDRAERITHEAVARSVRPVLGADVPVRVELVDEIPAADSGKYRHVISHAAPAAERTEGREATGV